MQFISESGKESRPFYFYERDPHESSVTWQVDRAEFDEMLLENATEKGVRVRTGVSVKKVLFEGGRATGVEGQDRVGKPFTIEADVIVG